PKLIPTSPILPPSHAQGRMRSERSAGDSRGGGVATAVGLGYAAPGPARVFATAGHGGSAGSPGPSSESPASRGACASFISRGVLRLGTRPALRWDKQKERNR